MAWAFFAIHFPAFRYNKKAFRVGKLFYFHYNRGYFSGCIE
jgi:hypothetical protein